MNRPFAVTARRFRPDSSAQLCAELAAIAGAGFFAREGCFLLRRLAGPVSHLALADFPDRTGYECFVNHLHMEDHTDRESFGQAILYLSCLVEAWEAAATGLDLTCIMGLDEPTSGAHVRCHASRPNEAWLLDDLDGYQSGLLAFSSKDAEILELLLR